MPLKEDADLPLGRIILAVVAVFALLGFGVAWYTGLENDKRAESLYAKAQDHFHNKNLDASLSNIEKALKIKEKPEYLKVKLNVLMNQNKVYESEQVLDKLTGYEPENAHFRRLSGLLAYNASNFEKAEEKYREAIEFEPDNAEYKVNLANLMMMQDKKTEAKALYEAIITKDPGYKFGWNQYITLFSNSGDYSHAVSVAKRAVQQFKTDSDFYFLLATVLDHQGNQKEAAVAYLRSLELEPMPQSIAARRIYEITGKRVPLSLEKMDSEQVPFESQGKLMFVHAWVNDVEGRFLVDTGASISVIFKGSAAKHGIKPSGSKLEAETAGGIIQSQIGYGSVQLGKNRMDSVVFAILPDAKKMDADGIIGMNFLDKFRMEIDKPNRKLTLTR